MDAIALLKEDHRTVEALFKKFEALGPRAVKSKQDTVERIIKELSIHASIEEAILYPAVRETVAKGGEVDDMVLEALEEHHVAKWVLEELRHMDPTNERFDAKTTVLMESVRHHVKEEEKDLFPKLRTSMGKKLLTELGTAMADYKKAAPTRPHPKAPDEPPGNLLSGPAAAIADRALDATRKLLRAG